MTLESRLEPFRVGAIAIPLTPATVGLFYKGNGDIIKSFHSGIEVNNLLPCDDIYHRHSFLNDKCEYFQVLIADYTKTICSNSMKKEKWSTSSAKNNTEYNSPCKMCLNKEVSVVLLPYRHVVTCKECNKKLEYSCICRAPCILIFM